LLLVDREDREMTDRRRTPRYVLETPLAGHAMPMQDVMVEDFTDDRLVVVSLDTHAVDDDLLVYLSMPHGLERYRAIVTSSTPAAMGGKLCCRLELRIIALEPEPDEDPEAPEGSTPSTEWKH
jgi:hypothetical protein